MLQTRLIGLEELLRRYLTNRISCPLRWVCAGARGDIYELPSMAAGKSDYGGLRKEADKVTISKSAYFTIMSKKDPACVEPGLSVI